MDIYKDLYYKLLGEVANLAERAEKIQADAEERYLEACEIAYADEVWQEALSSGKMRTKSVI